MFSTIDPNAEMGPVGMYIGAGLFALVACGTLVSGLLPQWRETAKWRGGVSRSPLGTIAFSFGLLVMAGGMVARGILNQHGPFTGIPAWLFIGGAGVLVLGLVYDFVRSMKKR